MVPTSMSAKNYEARYELACAVLVCSATSLWLRACLASYPGFFAIAFAAYGTMKVSRCHGQETLR